MKTWIIDDEPIAILLMEELLKPYDNVLIEGKYTDPVEALVEIVDKSVDLLFLDIEMGFKNGMDFAEKFMQINPNLIIIFVTAHSQYALNAFELNVVDYLLKPVHPARLQKTMARITEERKTSPKVGRQYRIKSFGEFSVMDENNTPIAWRTKKTKELFAYLWNQKSTFVDRDFLVEALFPDREKNKGNTLFSTTLYQLRKTLNDMGVDWEISFVNGKYMLEIDIISDFDLSVNLINSDSFDEVTLDQLLNMYQGKFMEYEDYPWVIDVSEDINLVVLSKVKKYLNEAILVGNYDLLEKTYMFIYRLDRLDDAVVADVIKFYRESNQFTKLNNFYKEHIQYLEEEVDVEPSHIIKKIYNQS